MIISDLDKPLSKGIDSRKPKNPVRKKIKTRFRRAITTSLTTIPITNIFMKTKPRFFSFFDKMLPIQKPSNIEATAKNFINGPIIGQLVSYMFRIKKCMKVVPKPTIGPNTKNANTSGISAKSNIKNGTIGNGIVIRRKDIRPARAPKIAMVVIIMLGLKVFSLI